MRIQFREIEKKSGTKKKFLIYDENNCVTYKQYIHQALHCERCKKERTDRLRFVPRWMEENSLFIVFLPGL